MKYWQPGWPDSDIAPNEVLTWLHVDSEKAFVKNQPTGYTKESVSYRINSQGLRGDELTVDAKFKILVSGCSHTFGVGINEKDIWCNQFAERITGAHVYNVAMGGRSCDYVVRSIYKTVDIIKPNLIMVMWPDISRFEEPAEGDTDLITWHSVHGSAGNKPYPSFWANENLQLYHFEKNQIFLENICAARNIPLIAKTYLDVKNALGHIDYGRDMMHDGPIWNLKASQIYWDTFQKLF